jgi:hypothetical protein
MWILKHPNLETLAQVSETQPESIEGWEELTEEEFSEWKESQRAAGWMPPSSQGQTFPDAEKYQVLDWLDDYGITSAHVEAALDGIPDPDQRRKAKVRWSSINRVPADNAFVVHVANTLGIDIKTAWFQILAK